MHDMRINAIVLRVILW